MPISPAEKTRLRNQAVARFLLDRYGNLQGLRTATDTLSNRSDTITINLTATRKEMHALKRQEKVMMRERLLIVRQHREHMKAEESIAAEQQNAANANANAQAAAGN